PIIVLQKVPLHSRVMRETGHVLKSSLRGTRVTRPPRLDRTTVRGARVLQPKPTPSPACNLRRRNSRRSARKLQQLPPDSDQSAIQLHHRESVGQRKTKSADRELDSGLNWRRSRRKNGATRVTAFPETKAGETGAVRATVSRKTKAGDSGVRRITASQNQSY
ncbi:hypothetical protein HID58_018839, partial [Brassica napus]